MGMKKKNNKQDTPVNPDSRDAISVVITYDKAIQGITGISEEIVSLAPGASFAFLLNRVFIKHPRIMDAYPPGVLGMTLNGRPPEPLDRLGNRDRVHLLIP